MPQEHCFRNCRYMSNFWSFLFTVVLCTFWQQCTTTETNSTSHAIYCWFNYTRISEGSILGLDSPCVGINCKNGSWGLEDCNTTKPKDRGDGCVFERHRGVFPECCQWVRGC
uniref:8.9 kDa family member n=1 Tax=Rhipicephalus zambeziensis TaxID=60191 RepID=A0A224YA67_9ACAR